MELGVHHEPCCAWQKENKKKEKMKDIRKGRKSKEIKSDTQVTATSPSGTRLD